MQSLGDMKLSIIPTAQLFEDHIIYQMINIIDGLLD